MFEIKDPSKINGLGPINQTYLKKHLLLRSEENRFRYQTKQCTFPEPFGPITNV